MSVWVWLAAQAALFCLLSVGFCLILYAAEMQWPRGELAGPKERKRATLFLIASAPIGVVSAWAFWSAYGLLGLGKIFPLFHLNAGFVITAILAVFGTDFFYYWFHRAQHRFEPLWRVHRTHHAIEKMGVPTGYQHAADPLLRAFFVSLPLTMLVSPAMAAGVGAFLAFHGYYLHSGTRLNFGKGAWLLTDNRVHRIHHSNDPAHFNHNYGITTMIWDKLFGTAYFPSADEWPTVGLKDVPEPKTLREFFLQPFRSVEALRSSAA